VNLVRGQVVRADVGLDEPKLFVVVSNNHRNRAWDTVLVARVTTSTKEPHRSIIDVPDREVVSGRVMCDDVVELFEDEIMSILGGLTPATMGEVNIGLNVALGLE
jgi:mRNA interferase MazF